MRSQRRNRSGAPKAAKKRELLGQAILAHPPVIRPQITHHQRMRFRCTTAGSQSITFTNLLDSMFVAATAVTGFQLWDVVKVKRVEMWSSPTSATTTVSVDFPGLLGVGAGDGQIVSDTSMGISPAHVNARPSSNSTAGQWQGPSALTAFSLLNCPLDAVIDVECSFRNSSVAPTSVTAAPVAAQPGQFYYRGLDGQAVAGTKFPAVANIVG